MSGGSRLPPHAGTAEHRAAAGSQATHSIAFGAVQEHQDNQNTAADPAPGQN